MLVKAGYGRTPRRAPTRGGSARSSLPPVLGAAAFLIAEFLKISYLDVLLMATIPTLLYYFALFLMVEIDARQVRHERGALRERRVACGASPSSNWFSLPVAGVDHRRFHALRLFTGALVFWATVTALATASCTATPRSSPTDLFRGREPLVKGIFQSKFFQGARGGLDRRGSRRGHLRGAGIIVGVVTPHRPRPQVQRHHHRLRGGLAPAHRDLHLAHRLDRASGFAVPVTASYIICAVIAAPALIKLVFPNFAAHYVHLLLRRALGSVAAHRALAFRGRGDHRRRSVSAHASSWKYTMPAFLVPFMFVLDPSGTGLLLTGSIKTLGNADWGSIALVTITAAIGIAALAGASRAGCSNAPTWIEQWMLIAAGLALVYPTALFDVIGIALIALVFAMQFLRRGGSPAKA